MKIKIDECFQTIFLDIRRYFEISVFEISRADCIMFLGPGCSKPTTSLVNVLLKFQMLISQIHQYFLLKKCEKLLQCKSFSHFFNKNISACIWL